MMSQAERGYRSSSPVCEKENHVTILQQLFKESLNKSNNQNKQNLEYLDSI